MEREKKTKAIEMTTGSIWKNLFFLSCPLVFSQVLEVLFNMSDVAVVGRFSDYRALGAVGSTTLLVTLFTGFLIGMGCGVNVRMAHELGARRRESVIKTVHSAFVICLIVGLLVGAACFSFAEGLLGILHTKEELMDRAGKGLSHRGKANCALRAAEPVSGVCGDGEAVHSGNFASGSVSGGVAA